MQHSEEAVGISVSYSCIPRNDALVLVYVVTSSVALTVHRFPVCSLRTWDQYGFKCVLKRFRLSDSVEDVIVV